MWRLIFLLLLIVVSENVNENAPRESIWFSVVLKSFGISLYDSNGLVALNRRTCPQCETFVVKRKGKKKRMHTKWETKNEQKKYCTHNNVICVFRLALPQILRTLVWEANHEHKCTARGFQSRTSVQYVEPNTTSIITVKPLKQQQQQFNAR